jgi:hypothetical protein
MLEPDDEPVESDCIHIHLSCSSDALTADAGHSADPRPLDAGVDEERPRWMPSIPGLAAVRALPCSCASSAITSEERTGEAWTRKNTVDQQSPVPDTVAMGVAKSTILTDLMTQTAQKAPPTQTEIELLKGNIEVCEMEQRERESEWERREGWCQVGCIGTFLLLLETCCL